MKNCSCLINYSGCLDYSSKADSFRYSIYHIKYIRHLNYYIRHLNYHISEMLYMISYLLKLYKISYLAIKEIRYLSSGIKYLIFQ